MCTHIYAHKPERRWAKQKSRRNQIDFLYHLAGSSHQNINTIFIDAATAPAAAAALWEQGWVSEKQKDRRENERELKKKKKKRERGWGPNHFLTKPPAPSPKICWQTIKKVNRSQGGSGSAKNPGGERAKGDDRWEEGRWEGGRNTEMEDWSRAPVSTAIGSSLASGRRDNKDRDWGWAFCPSPSSDPDYLHLPSFTLHLVFHLLLPFSSLYRPLQLPPQQLITFVLPLL